MYTGATFDSSGQFYSLQYESLTYLGGWYRGWVWRSIRDRMSYRNQYMCSGEATSFLLRLNSDTYLKIIFEDRIRPKLNRRLAPLLRPTFNKPYVCPYAYFVYNARHCFATGVSRLFFIIL